MSYTHEPKHFFLLIGVCSFIKRSYLCKNAARVVILSHSFMLELWYFLLLISKNPIWERSMSIKQLEAERVPLRRQPPQATASADVAKRARVC